MSFLFALVCPGDAPRMDVEPSGTHFVEVVMDGCAALEEAGCRFEVSGFGDDAWRVDVAHDLSIALEQLPEVLLSLRAGVGVTWGFVEQGVERHVDIEPSESDVVTLRCRSGTTWRPDPVRIAVSRNELEERLVALAASFARAVGLLAPDLAHNPPIPAWRDRVI
ncbi:MAG TPA: hypothetical protein VFU19_19130 [Iamia sp.]|nr:hypothetical protein [Iamia sp.]